MIPKNILLALAWLLVGCGPPASVIEEKIEQTYKIEPNAVISIDNVDGSIMVYGGNVTELTVRAIKRAYSQKSLDQIGIGISSQLGAVSIRTEMPTRPEWSLSDRSGTVDYVLVVPQTVTISRMKLANGELLLKGMHGGSVRAELGNGYFHVQDCFCDLHLNAVRGGIMISYGWWDTARFSLDATIASGKTLLLLPSEASFHLLAEATTGQIFNDFGEQHERTGGPVTKIDKQIGPAPNAEFRIHATEGNINIVARKPLPEHADILPDKL